MEIREEYSEKFVSWLFDEVTLEARGNRYQRLPVAPGGRFWLGRLAPVEKVQASRYGQRAERLEPCEVGLRFRSKSLEQRSIGCTARMVAWRRLENAEDTPEADKWEKTARIEVQIDIRVPAAIGERISAGNKELSEALRSVGADGLSAEIHAELEQGKNGPQVAVTVVNVSPIEHPVLDTNLYEVELSVDTGPTLDFVLDDLPDSFRYERTVKAYGINGGVEIEANQRFVTTDFACSDRMRPLYWDDEVAGEQPPLSFQELASNPIKAAGPLVEALERWTNKMWSEDLLLQRQKDGLWNLQMLQQAQDEAAQARIEVERIKRGLEQLATDPILCRAFALANRSFDETHSIAHDSWRPFQLGFVMANLEALSQDSSADERSYVDTLWFATGGGKTETYLLYTLTAAFNDRLRGKRHGVTSWGRFPLRMLSLQQTQRFADVLAAAELIRLREEIGGSEFSLGFLVGEGGSPNRIEPLQSRDTSERRLVKPDPDDPLMPARYNVLIHCPFCGSTNLRMQFDKRRWALDHVCDAEGCPWGGNPLPFRIVDEEIYRWLPTVVLGTLDKAASISMQAAMRGFYGAPEGFCPLPNHGFTYAPRSKSPTGCLFPGCTKQPKALPQDSSLFAPTIRMQDELHLLRDSLGSIDAHYEALLDQLQEHWGSQPKLIASSATLAGHDEQVQTLYRRDGRMFPIPGPWSTRSFWSKDSGRLARRFVALAPRGVTLEYANDQLTETLQNSVRKALGDPILVASEIGVPPEVIGDLVWAYGTDVTYGNTLKDVEAAARSAESQIPLEPLNSQTLTGRTPLEDVRTILARLVNPEDDFKERIHLIAASSMLSHGVDIDRLNVMVMLGLPLSTAEFIQTTSRVGRKYPGLVLVLHKIGRERDAAVYGVFPSFVQHMDRLVDSVPVTAKSRRVLEMTFAGIEQGRIYGIHEPAALAAGLKQLTVPDRLRKAFNQLNITELVELDEIINTLGFTGPLDENLRLDLEEYVRELYEAIFGPAPPQYVSELFPTGRPMLSLRDVEEQVPVFSRRRSK